MGIFAPPGLGTVAQVVTTGVSASTTGTTLLPNDDTIPQNTEGDQYMSLSITPKSTTNTLVIIANVWVSSSVANNMGVALFQDSTANALAATHGTISATDFTLTIPLIYQMTAGTTSSTTFKIRSGGSIAGTTTFNGSSGTRKYGAITKSSMTIWEYIS